jgi:dolichyl-phosphate-mannose-protein mannosyltransferase
LIAYLVGYRGDATQLDKAGKSYVGTEFPYVALRFVSVVVGSLAVPLSYLTLRANAVRSAVAVLTSSLVLLENLTVLHSTLFMPDSFFLFGLSLSVYTFTKFGNSEPFGYNWFRYLVLTGVALGLSVSVKWIGISTVIWVVATSAIKLWYIVGDVKLSNSTVTKHFAFRTLLVLVPVLVYMGTFFVQLMLLQNYTRDSALLSTGFQRSLNYNDISNIPKYVTFGSTVTLRHTGSMGGYLHSHKYKYKTGSRNNQVTVFDYKDFNNEWVIEPVESFNETDPRIKLDSLVTLRHKATGAILSVSEEKPPISEQEYDFELSTIGNSSTEGDETEQFKLKSVDGSNDGYIESFHTKLQIYSPSDFCTVLSHDLKLPDWGFNQQEVLCIKSPQPSRSTFYIETVKYPKDFDYDNTLPLFKETQPQRDPSFLSKFIELNSKMYRIFRAIDSSNGQDARLWPLDIEGKRYNTMKESTLYAIGNPIPFWLTVIFISTFIILKSLDFIKTDRVSESIYYKSNALMLVLGYFAHYLPYVLQEGEWFLVYYIPALYFGILLIGVTFEYIHFKNLRLGQIVSFVSVLAALWFYSTLSPITFASSWTSESCEAAAKWSQWWDFRCDMYSSAKSITSTFDFDV